MAEPIPFDHGLDRLDPDYIINISYMSRSTTTPGRLVGRLERKETEGMFENKTKVLLILPQDALDRARVLAGKAVPLTHSREGPRGTEAGQVKSFGRSELVSSMLIRGDGCWSRRLRSREVPSSFY